MGYRLALAEKPSVAQAIAKVLGASKRCDGYLEGNGWLVSWCVGHLVELAEPESYDEKYRKWRYEDLPIFPEKWKYEVSPGTRKQFAVVKELMNRSDVTSWVLCTDSGREGELIGRLVYHMCASCFLEGQLPVNHCGIYLYSPRQPHRLQPLQNRSCEGTVFRIILF